MFGSEGRRVTFKSYKDSHHPAIRQNRITAQNLKQLAHNSSNQLNGSILRIIGASVAKKDILFISVC